MIRAIIFDFDGTIANTERAYLIALNKLSEKYSYQKISSLNLLKKIGTEKVLGDILKLKEGAIPTFLKEFKEILETNSETYELVNGMDKSISDLSKEYELFILSSNLYNSIANFLGRNNLKKNIKKIYSNVSLFEKEKFIEILLKENNLKKEEVIYIGDEIRDIISCKKARIKIISVTWGLCSEELLKNYNPDCIINNMEEINKYIDFKD